MPGGPHTTMHSRLVELHQRDLPHTSVRRISPSHRGELGAYTLLAFVARPSAGPLSPSLGQADFDPSTILAHASSPWQVFSHIVRATFESWRRPVALSELLGTITAVHRHHNGVELLGWIAPWAYFIPETLAMLDGDLKNAVFNIARAACRFLPGYPQSAPGRRPNEVRLRAKVEAIIDGRWQPVDLCPFQRDGIELTPSVLMPLSRYVNVIEANDIDAPVIAGGGGDGVGRDGGRGRGGAMDGRTAQFHAEAEQLRTWILSHREEVFFDLAVHPSQRQYPMPRLAIVNVRDLPERDSINNPLLPRVTRANPRRRHPAELVARTDAIAHRLEAVAAYDEADRRDTAVSCTPWYQSLAAVDAVLPVEAWQAAADVDLVGRGLNPEWKGRLEEHMDAAVPGSLLNRLRAQHDPHRSIHSEPWPVPDRVLYLFNRQQHGTFLDRLTASRRHAGLPPAPEAREVDLYRTFLGLMGAGGPVGQPVWGGEYPHMDLTAIFTGGQDGGGGAQPPLLPQVHLVYHGLSAGAMASTIVETGFLALGNLDAGWYGAGLYFTHHLEYALGHYARSDAGVQYVLVCAVIISTPLAVVAQDSATAAGGVTPGSADPPDAVGLPYQGRPMRGQDTHLVIVDGQQPCPRPLRAPTAAGALPDGRRTSDRPFSEVVIQHRDQILPLAVMAFSQRSKPQ